MVTRVRAVFRPEVIHIVFNSVENHRSDRPKTYTDDTNDPDRIQGAGLETAPGTLVIRQGEGERRGTGLFEGAKALNPEG